MDIGQMLAGFPAAPGGWPDIANVAPRPGTAAVMQVPGIAGPMNIPGGTPPFVPPVVAGGGAPPVGPVMPAESTPAPVGAPDNRSMWQKMLAQVQDPNFRQAMFLAGINMLRSPEYGQGAGDVIANSLQTGVGTLQSLRERDRLIADKKAKDAEEKRRWETETGQRSRQIDISQGGLDLQSQNAQAEASQRAATLEETIRHNRAVEANQAAANSNDRYRWSQYNSQRPAELEMIDMLAREYQTKGMPEIEAKARATEFIRGKKVPSTAEIAQDLYVQSRTLALQRWNADLNNIGKLPPNWAELDRQMQSEAMQSAVRLQGMSTGVPPETARGGAIQRQGAAPAPAAGRAPAAAPAAPSAPAAAPQPLKPGDIKGNYRFKGGDPKVQANWEKVS